jgi:putative transposase
MFDKELYQEKYRIKSTRLQNWDYSNSGYYFVTTCVKNRECIFGEIVNDKMILNRNGYIVKQCWRDLPNYYDNCKLDSFIIMPNHIHGIIQIKGYKYKSVKKIYDNNEIGNVSNVETIHESSLWVKYRRKMLLSKIVGKFKMRTSKIINFNNSKIHFQWQKSYYDHIVRDEDDLNRIRNYIQNNPIKWNWDRNNLR